MRTLNFLKKEMLHLLHAPETVLLMLLFPILLTWVLGTAFSKVSARTIDLPDTRIPILAQDGMLKNMYLSNAHHAGITLEELTQEQLDSKLKNEGLRQYITLDDGNITLHSDNEDSLEALQVKMYSTTFAQQASIAAHALRAGRLDKMGLQVHQYASIEGISAKNEPDSFGYYGVTMLTMIIMYGSMQTVSLLAMEKQGRTGLRLKASPYNMSKVFLVKTAAALMMLLLQALLLVLINHHVYGVNYRSIPMVMLMIVPVTLFSISLGVAAYQLLATEAAANTLLNILVIALVFLGRGYIMVSMDNPFFANLARFSPVGWVNEGLFEFVYQGSTSYLSRPALWTLAISLALYALAYILYKNEEGSDHVAAH